MKTDNYTDLVERLENDELEQTSIGVEVYNQLMAAYLYLDKFSDARYLWMRIPAAFKTENKELNQLQLLNVALQDNNYTDFFVHVKYEWSESIKPMIDELMFKTREHIFSLVSIAYTSIYEHNLQKITQLSTDDLRSACAALGWTYEADGQQHLWLPKPKETKNCAYSDDQLLKLTEFVSFLEN